MMTDRELIELISSDPQRREARDQAGALVLLRAHDISQRDTFRAEDLQAWQAARVEDQKRITSLEWNVNRIWEMCR